MSDPTPEIELVRKRLMDATFDIVEGVVIDRGALADLLVETERLLRELSTHPTTEDPE